MTYSHYIRNVYSFHHHYIQVFNTFPSSLFCNKKWLKTTCIVELRDVLGQELKGWAPSSVARDLKSGFKLNGKDCIAFIKSLEEKETNVVGEPRKKFLDFETVYLPSV